MRTQLPLAAAVAAGLAFTALTPTARAASTAGPRAPALDSAQSRLDAALFDEPVTVRTNDRPSVMGIIARNTLGGALTGGIIGGAIYLLDTPRHNPERIGYWAAGGAVVGAAVGAIQAVAYAGRGNADRAPTSLPGTVMIPALRLKL